LIGYVIISRPSEYVEDYKEVKNKDGEMDVILFFNSEYYTADRKHYLGAKYTYIIYALVGIRDSEKSPWKIYWIRIIILPSQDNYWSARKAIRSILKDGFKDIQITCPNEIPDTLFPRQLEMMEHTTFREERMGFNIDDPGFWSDSCTLWKIGQRAKGLYFFQTWTHQPTADQIIIYPNINYPDSLLNLFTR
jgi:hypothetical protein